MTKPTWTNCTVRLGDLKPWEHNPRTSTRAQAKRILKSWEKFGQAALVCVDPDNGVLDGHQRLSALLMVHGPDYVVEARRSDRPMPEAERQEFVLAMANATGSWNWDVTSGWSSDILTEWGFDKDTLQGWGKDYSNLSEFIKANDETPDFQPVGADEQGRLDQKKPVTCPHCGEEFTPK